MVKSVVAPRREDKNTNEASIWQTPSFFAGQMCDKRKEVRQKDVEVQRETAAKMGADAE